MSRHRQLDTRFWEDFYISELDPIEKLLFLYFILNSRTALCGAYEMPLGIVAGETGIEKGMVKKILDRFENDNKMKYVDGYVLIRNYGKFLSVNPSILLGIEREKKNLPEHILDMVDTYCIQPGYSLGTESIQDGDILKPKLKPKLKPEPKPKLKPSETLQTEVLQTPARSERETILEGMNPDTREVWDMWETTFSEITTSLEDNRAAINKLLELEGSALQVKRLMGLAAKAWSEKYAPKEAKASSPKSLWEKRATLLAWGKGKFAQTTSNRAI